MTRSRRNNHQRNREARRGAPEILLRCNHGTCKLKIIILVLIRRRIVENHLPQPLHLNMEKCNGPFATVATVSDDGAPAWAPRRQRRPPTLRRWPCMRFVSEESMNDAGNEGSGGNRNDRLLLRIGSLHRHWLGFNLPTTSPRSGGPILEGNRLRRQPFRSCIDGGLTCCGTNDSGSLDSMGICG